MSDHPIGPDLPPPPGSSFINGIVGASLQQRLLIALLTVMLIGVGLRALHRLPVDAYSDLSPPMVEIITQWPGHSAEEVERLITVPVEIGMNGIPRANVVRSVSLYALSDVVITLDQGTDREFARQQAFNRIGDISLPTGVTPSISPLTSPSGLIYRYTLQSPDRSPTELKTFEDWTVEPQFKSVSGVADDSGFGGGTMQYQVLVDQVKLAAAGLSIQQVQTALGANNNNAGGGFYSEGGQFYYVRGLGRLRTVEDIGNVVVAVQNGNPVLVKDIGKVTLGIAPRLGQFGIGRQNDAVEGVIMLRTGEKTQDVLKRVEAKTRELNRILPRDVKVHPFYDLSDLIHHTRSIVEQNLLRGMVLVLVVLIFFLYDIRTGLMSSPQEERQHHDHHCRQCGDEREAPRRQTPHPRIPPHLLGRVGRRLRRAFAHHQRTFPRGSSRPKGACTAWRSSPPAPPGWKGRADTRTSCPRLLSRRFPPTASAPGRTAHPSAH